MLKTKTEHYEMGSTVPILGSLKPLRRKTVRISVCSGSLFRLEKSRIRDLCRYPVVQTPLSNTVGKGSIPGQEAMNSPFFFFFKAGSVERY